MQVNIPCVTSDQLASQWLIISTVNLTGFRDTWKHLWVCLQSVSRKIWQNMEHDPEYEQNNHISWGTDINKQKKREAEYQFNIYFSASWHNVTSYFMLQQLCLCTIMMDCVSLNYKTKQNLPSFPPSVCLPVCPSSILVRYLLTATRRESNTVELLWTPTRNLGGNVCPHSITDRSVPAS